MSAEDRRDGSVELPRDTGMVFVGAVGARGVDMLRGLLVARLLGPAGYGIWRAIALVLVWAGQSHLGVLHTLCRELPMAEARGRYQEMASLRRTAMTTSVALATVPAVAVLAWALYGVGGESTAWILAAVLIPLQALHFVQIESLEAERRFGRVTGGELIHSLTMLPLVLLLVPIWGLPGLLVAAVGQRLVTVAFLGRGDRRPGLVAVTIDRVRRLVRAGFVYWLASLSTLLYTTIDQFLVLGMLSVSQLGLYGVALAATSPLRLWVHSLDTAARPRTLAAWARQLQKKGEDGRDANGRESGSPDCGGVRVARRRNGGDRVARILLPPFTGWFLLAQGLGYFLLPPAIGLVLPQYRGIGPAVKVLCVGASAAFAAIGVGNVLLAADRRRELLSSYLVAAAVSLAVGLLGIRLGLGFVGATLGMVAGELARAVVAGSLAWRVVSGSLRGAGLTLLRLFVPGLVLVATLVATETILELAATSVPAVELSATWLRTTAASSAPAFAPWTDTLVRASMGAVTFMALLVPAHRFLRRQGDEDRRESRFRRYRRLLLGLV